MIGVVIGWLQLALAGVHDVEVATPQSNSFKANRWVRNHAWSHTRAPCVSPLHK
jgi:hypothetical protein